MSNNKYKFKGYDWTELAECWGITVEETPMIKNDETNMFMMKEKIEVVKYFNNTRVVFTVDDEEEVLAEKVKRFIIDKLCNNYDELNDIRVRTDIENFLKELIKEGGYCTPMYEGMLKIESNTMFAKWVCNNLEMLWN